MCAKLTGMGLNIFEQPEKAESHPGRRASSHSRYCRMVTLWLVGPTHFCANTETPYNSGCLAFCSQLQYHRLDTSDASH